MKSHHLLYLFVFMSCLTSFAHAKDYNAEQPDVGCVEEQYPPVYNDSACKPYAPTDIVPGQKDFYSGQEGYCRAREVMRRYQADYSSYPFAEYEGAWITIHALQDRDAKIDAIYAAAEQYQMPPTFLYAVLKLESQVSGYAMIRDHENYSMGPGSINILDWCEWVKSQPVALQKEVHWPADVPCSDKIIPPKINRAIFNLALPHTEKQDMAIVLNREDLKAVPDEKLLDKLDADEVGLQQLAAIRSFTNYGNLYQYGIPAAAYHLSQLFEVEISDDLKAMDRYKSGETYHRSCKRPYVSPYHPAAASWLLAYSAHNIGSAAIELFDYFYKGEVPSQVGGRSFLPEDVVNAIYWSGKVSSNKKKIDYKVRNRHFELTKNKDIAYLWPCIARVNTSNMAKHMVFEGGQPILPHYTSACLAPTKARQKSSGQYEGKIPSSDD